MPPIEDTQVQRDNWDDEDVRTSVARNVGGRSGTSGVGRYWPKYKNISAYCPSFESCAGQGRGIGRRAGQNGRQNPAVQKSRVSSKRRLLLTL